MVLCHPSGSVDAFVIAERYFLSVGKCGGAATIVVVLARLLPGRGLARSAPANEGSEVAPSAERA